MKTYIRALIATALMLFGGLLPFARAAVIVSEITSTEFTNLTTTTPTSWNVKFQAGGESGQYESHEVSLTVGNTSPIPKDHVWAYPEFIEVSRGSLGNIYATAGSDVFDFGVTPTLSFNTILVKVSDFGTLQGSVSFQNGIYVINNEKKADIPNVSVNESARYFRMDLGETNPVFEIDGRFNANLTSSNKGYVEFRAMNIVPEPGMLLILPTMVLCLLRRRR